MEGVDLVDDIDNYGSDKESADISPGVLNELGPVFSSSCEELPAERREALSRVSESRANSEEGGYERLNEEPEVQRPAEATDEVLHVLREELTHTIDSFSESWWIGFGSVWFYRRRIPSSAQQLI
jgi:hypothetical protein